MVNREKERDSIPKPTKDGWFTERKREEDIVFLNLQRWLVNREKERDSILKPTKDGWFTKRKREEKIVFLNLQEVVCS